MTDLEREFLDVIRQIRGYLTGPKVNRITFESLMGKVMGAIRKGEEAEWRDTWKKGRRKE